MGVRVDVVVGVEGGEHYRVEPLQGFASPAVGLTGEQAELLARIYSSDKPLSAAELARERGRSVYKVLKALERRGLIVVRRRRLERTLPGEVLYRIISGVAGGDCAR
jgi:chromosome segregation and condensation protein ScpB